MLTAKLVGSKRTLLWRQIGGPATPDREPRSEHSLVSADQRASGTALFGLASVCVGARDFNNPWRGGLDRRCGGRGRTRQASGLAGEGEGNGENDHVQELPLIY
ncbi:hypothetical protein GCM10017620_02510 [Brevundimonas intermedia]|uniref:Uncharacterized protein n=1 Tax=Brevundimonas intermedia TaxID=74315 RepID=A0ABQ5T7E9_9CAUL|nr:hypothetical protein GCM10017620_02510 [Brevundimonas intermedia]